MGDRATFDDVELYLTGYVRAQLADAAVLVTNQLPATPWPAGPIVAVRYDGGPVGLVTEDAQVGVTIVGAAADTTGALTGNLARRVRDIIHYCWQDADGPVADVRDLNGPVRVTTAERPERYLTATLRVVGREV